MWLRTTMLARNSLCRSSDRIEAWMSFVVMMTMLMLAPAAGCWAGREMYDQDLRDNAADRQNVIAYIKSASR